MNVVIFITSSLYYYKVLKFYAWEPSFHNKIQDIRKPELSFVRGAAQIAAFTTTSSFTMSYIVSQRIDIASNPPCVICSLSLLFYAS